MKDVTKLLTVNSASIALCSNLLKSLSKAKSYCKSKNSEKLFSTDPNKLEEFKNNKKNYT